MSYLEQLKTGGFDFENHIRNKALTHKGIMAEPKKTKTGTTICGVVCKDGIVLGADTRATAGTIVADKNCDKIHYLAPNMYCCGAGTAADTQFVTQEMASQLELLRLNSGRESRVSTAVTKFCTKLHRYQGHIGAALILGGFDVAGPHLVMISPYGNCSYLPYVSMGSGSLAATAILEAEYKDDLSIEEGKQLVIRAIEAGIIHDLGSGSNVDLCVLTKGTSDLIRNIKKDHSKVYSRPKPYVFTPGTTNILRTYKFPNVEKIEIEDEGRMQIE